MNACEIKKKMGIFKKMIKKKKKKIKKKKIKYKMKNKIK